MAPINHKRHQNMDIKIATDTEVVIGLLSALTGDKYIEVINRVICLLLDFGASLDYCETMIRATMADNTSLAIWSEEGMFYFDH
jgi:hypothetical protein